MIPRRSLLGAFQVVAVVVGFCGGKVLFGGWFVVLSGLKGMSVGFEVEKGLWCFGGVEELNVNA